MGARQRDAVLQPAAAAAPHQAKVPICMLSAGSTPFCLTLENPTSQILAVPAAVLQAGQGGAGIQAQRAWKRCTGGGPGCRGEHAGWTGLAAACTPCHSQQNVGAFQIHVHNALQGGDRSGGRLGMGERKAAKWPQGGEGSKPHTRNRQDSPPAKLPPACLHPLVAPATAPATGRSWAVPRTKPAALVHAWRPHLGVQVVESTGHIQRHPTAAAPPGEHALGDAARGLPCDLQRTVKVAACGTKQQAGWQSAT